ncbi:hypothetical protein EJB05_17378 [Eragrostis curvula]|uniref:Uncharacterized protein n=1 Tax=Eragrostis curvula TaxID=38414 RepID=A0A5J9VIX2_9POAL|nr:hypothetical protein EJB05_17378 [Eragrostis curvula]
MSGSRRSSEEQAKKKLKTHKTSSKDCSDKAISEANVTALSAAVPSANQPKTSHSAKPSFAFKPPVICSALVLFSIPEDGGSNSSGSKAQSVPKKVISKGFSSVANDISASTVDVRDASAAEKAKIQDKAFKGADSVLAKSGSKAKIQDKTCVDGPDVPPVAPVHNEGVAEASAQGCLSSLSVAGLRQIADNLRPLTDRSQVQLPSEPGVVLREPLSPSAGGDLFLHSVFEAMLGEFLPFDMTFDSVEATGGSLTLCDDVPSNTFVMSARAAAPFVAAAERLRFPQVENELVLQGGDTLYKSLLSSQMKSLAITQASLRQFNELTLARADRDRLRKDLSTLESKIKEKEDALAFSEKRVVDLSVEKETLVKSTEDFKAKVASLEKQLEDLDSSLAKALEANKFLRGKVETADQEAASFAKAEELRLSSLCSHIQDALISVGTIPDQIPENASTEQRQSWLSVNIPFVVKACRAFSTNAVHLAIRDLLHSLDVEGSNVLAKVASDDFKFSTVDSTPRPVVEALLKVASHFDESFWNRVQSVGRLPQSEASSDISLSEFATPKASSDLVSGKCVAPDSSSDVSLSEFATPEPSSSGLIRREPPIEVFSSPSRFDLSSDSSPLPPVEGGESSFSFPLGSLVAVGRVYRPEADVPEGSRGRNKRRPRGRCPRGSSSSHRGAAKKKKGGDVLDSSSSFDAASHVERMISSGIIDHIFQRPYSPSNGYNFDEFSIVCEMLLELGLIVKREPDDGSP